MITALLRCTSNACNPLKSRGHSANLWLSQYTRLPPHEYPISEYVVCKITHNLYATRSDVKIETSSCNLTAGFGSKADVLYYLCCNRLWEPTVFSMTPYNKMNPGYFPLAAIALKPQQIPMFLHISARVWGRRWSPHTSEQKGSMLKPQ